MGFYGTYCLDCNHSCHPELHPYEWVWWLKADKYDFTTTKTWLIGLMHESSNRMKNWSQSPMTGSIKIPFAVRCDNESGTSLIIKVEHLVFDKFMEENASALPVPAINYTAEQNGSFSFEEFPDLNIEVEFSTPLLTEAYRYGFSQLNHDEQNRIVSGFFHIVTSVSQLYTARVIFEIK